MEVLEIIVLTNGIPSICLVMVHARSSAVATLGFDMPVTEKQIAVTRSKSSCAFSENLMCDATTNFVVFSQS